MQAAKLIGSSPLVTNYAYSCSFFNLNSIYAQSLRWKRKPIWLPTAKTKIFRVPERIRCPDDEYAEILRLYNNYRTYLRSVVTYMTEVEAKKEIQLDQAVLDKIEKEDYERCVKLNEEWNKKVAAEREIRLEKEKEERNMKILQNIEMGIKRNQEILSKVEEQVRKAKESKSTFITRENIDQAIDKILEDTVNHNKALELDGSWYTDTSGLPIPKTENTDKMQIKQYIK